MNILVVLAILVVFGLLRVPSSQSVHVGDRMVGRVLRLVPIWIRRADSHVRHLDLHGNRLARDPGVRFLERGAS